MLSVLKYHRSVPLFSSYSCIGRGPTVSHPIARARAASACESMRPGRQLLVVGTQEHSVAAAEADAFVPHATEVPYETPMQCKLVSGRMGVLASGRAFVAACLSEIPGPHLGGRCALTSLG